MYLEQSQRRPSTHQDSANDPVFPALPRPIGREHALWLLQYFYAPRYGKEICQESPVTLRIKIRQLQVSLRQSDRSRAGRFAIRQQICAYERVAELLEMFPIR